MADDTVLARLAEFQPTDATVRLVDGLLKIVPGAPQLQPYPALPSAVAAMGGTDADVARVTPLLNDEAVRDVLWMTRMVDTGDRGYAVATGLVSAVQFFLGGKEKRGQALETDKQQRNDAVLKALALAYIAFNGFEGPIPQRAKAFVSTPSGQALLAYYAAVEVALPFADNALTSGGDLVDQLMDNHGGKQLERLSSLAGGRSMDGVATTLSALTGPIKTAVDAVWPHVDKIADVARRHLPGALATGDKVAGALAGVADVMPVYRYLGGRLAAEAAIVKAGLR